MNRKYAPLRIGQKLFDYTVIDLSAGKGKGGVHLALFKCTCGRTKALMPCLVIAGHRKSCGHASVERFKAMLRARHAACRADAGSRARKVLFKSYRAHARQRKLAFTLSDQEFFALTKKPCAYCGCPPSNIQRYRHYRQPDGRYDEKCLYSGVDRIDNNEGYTPKNTAPCCATCNLAKRAMSRTQFLTWIRKVYNYAFTGLR